MTKQIEGVYSIVISQPHNCPKCKCTCYASIEHTGLHGKVALSVRCSQFNCDFKNTHILDISQFVHDNNMLK